MSQKKRSHAPPVSNALDRVAGETPDDYLYQQIFDAILAQRLLTGMKPTEEALAEIFPVSRTVVRRAPLRLSHDDTTVVIRPNHGASDASLNEKQACEILAARCLIEGAIVREVTAAADKKAVTALCELVK